VNWRESRPGAGNVKLTERKRKTKRPLPDRERPQRATGSEREARRPRVRRARVVVVEGPQHPSGGCSDQQDLAGAVVAVVVLATARRREPVVAIVVHHTIAGVIAAVEPVAATPVVMAAAIVVPATAVVAVAVTTIVMTAAIIAIVAIVPVARVVVARRVGESGRGNGAERQNAGHQWGKNSTHERHSFAVSWRYINARAMNAAQHARSSSGW